MVVKISIYDIQSLIGSLMIGAKFDIEYRDLGTEIINVRTHS
jgi:hypothetical protein